MAGFRKHSSAGDMKGLRKMCSVYYIMWQLIILKLGRVEAKATEGREGLSDSGR